MTIGSRSSTTEIRDAIKALQTSEASEQIEIDALAEILRQRGTAAAALALAECGYGRTDREMAP